jgi:hypothetical protein
MDLNRITLSPADPNLHFIAMIAIDTKLGYTITPGTLVMWKEL